MKLWGMTKKATGTLNVKNALFRIQVQCIIHHKSIEFNQGTYNHISLTIMKYRMG